MQIDIALIFIIVIIIAIQVYFFVMNVIRMHQFNDIFSMSYSWKTTKGARELVNGIAGEGNEIFLSIVDSINEYLSNNAGSVIDFGLLKDSVDRHCDSVEEDIATLTPIPLYCGLAGTMIGVIKGLYNLLINNSISTLVNSDVDLNLASNGIEGLLSGIALAMIASIMGIILTTINTILFKRYKLNEESGKNSFLAWMQAVLLPELPQDISQALANLAKNLNKFNKTFSQNTVNLKDALSEVNESYATQAEVIKAIHEMDVAKMAKVNIQVLRELQKCTDKLETFNEYLNDIEGYTDAIHNFEEQFQHETNRLHVLEEIRDFFTRYKSEISHSTADADKVLRDSLDQIKDSTATNVEELRTFFVQQCESFKDIIKEEKEGFVKLSNDLQTQFDSQMANMPQVAKQLAEISHIPSKLDQLIDKIESRNLKMLNDVSHNITQILQEQKDSINKGENKHSLGKSFSMPSWMLKIGWGAIVIIAIACILNIIKNCIYFISYLPN